MEHGFPEDEAGRLQVLCSTSHVYVKGAKTVLKCCRKTGKLCVSTHSDLAKSEALNDLGDVVGLFGKLDFDDGPYLLLIAQSSKVGVIGPRSVPVYRIDKLVAIPVQENATLNPVSLEESGLDKFKAQQKRLLKFVTNQRVNKAVDEVLKLVNDSASFYFSTQHDLTLRSQRFNKNPNVSANEFFWNKTILKDLFNENGDPLEESREWYLRRGIDELGNVANYVESEMMVNIFGHTLSFVQIRGSVPIFWSQKGYRYRPPLTINKPMDESISVFKTHLTKVKAEYEGPVTMVNLVDHTGREFALGEAFLKHVLELDDPDSRYFSFDFHDHCRALRFDNVSILLNALEPCLAETGFCWIDKSGQMVRQQSGIVRTNCVDCLDRTNVVQSAISQNMCAGQALKLGLIEPFTETPEVLVQVLQTMWAEHGDFISRQYAGTNALKGDITRGGQRKLVGMMKDGYNSASRYYLSHVKDARRQQAIDAIVSGDGRSVGSKDKNEEAESKALDDEEESSDDEDEDQVAENIGRMVHETARFILPENEVLVGGWALVDASNMTNQVDTVLLLTRSHIYVAYYAEDSEKLIDLKTILFSEVQFLEVARLDKSERVHLRLNWIATDSEAKKATWRAAKTRLFNNVAIALKDATEADEYVQAIAEQIRMTMTLCGFPVELKRPEKLGSTSGKDNQKLNLLNALSSKLTFASLTKRGSRKDELNSSTTQGMSQSKSDGLISNSVVLLGKLQDRIRTPFSRSSIAVNPPNAAPSTAMPALPDGDLLSVGPAKRDPFQSYKQEILQSNSKVVML